MSNDFEWIIEEDGFEWFSDNGTRYDVQVAKQIIIDQPREIVRVPVCDFVEDTIPNEQDHTVDLEVPVIVATRPDGDLVLIDGLHRLSKALFYQISTLPAVILTIDETEKTKF